MRLERMIKMTFLSAASSAVTTVALLGYELPIWFKFSVIFFLSVVIIRVCFEGIFILCNTFGLSSFSLKNKRKDDKNDF